MNVSFSWRRFVPHVHVVTGMVIACKWQWCVYCHRLIDNTKARYIQP